MSPSVEDETKLQTEYKVLQVAISNIYTQQQQQGPGTTLELVLPLFNNSNPLGISY